MDHLYEDVRAKIRRKIFDGTFPEGEKIPPERELSTALGVSRVTLRKALAELSTGGILKRVVGSGTVVTLPNAGNPVSRDLVVLIAPSQNPFFSDFIRAFQQKGQEKGSMVLYVEKPQAETIEDSLYILFERGIRNAVIWPDACSVQQEKLRRLRGLGMNLVFFDTNAGIPYADCVFLDNRRAVDSLVDACLQEEGKMEGQSPPYFLYLGWDQNALFSSRERQDAFLKKMERSGLPGSNVLLPWGDMKSMVEKLKHCFEDIHSLAQENAGSRRKTAVICGDGEIAGEAVNVLEQCGRYGCSSVQIAGIDEFPGCSGHREIICRQNIAQMVSIIFDSLGRQAESGIDWRAQEIPVPGILEMPD